MRSVSMTTAPRIGIETEMCSRGDHERLLSREAGMKSGTLSVSRFDGTAIFLCAVRNGEHFRRCKISLRCASRSVTWLKFPTVKISRSKVRRAEWPAARSDQFSDFLAFFCFLYSSSKSGKRPCQDFRSNKASRKWKRTVRLREINGNKKASDPTIGANWQDRKRLPDSQRWEEKIEQNAIFCFFLLVPKIVSDSSGIGKRLLSWENGSQPWTFRLDLPRGNTRLLLKGVIIQRLEKCIADNLQWT